ncbi:unnamed protein product [Parascedosporium putredinis]|uniref:Uncharacterized protein n=1 Tax=Parascedosporium putredinis TaxID=1442378 RepID=A0A9P1HC60_9PEZI|nr:unnamed protein product [Parascedosporium putredinis]CAI8004025.1 unnamed protein product [Parascedosporium putredinis]
MDWLGVFTIVPGLVLFVYALTDSSSAPKGWASPHIIATFIIGVLLLAAAVYTQGWVSKYPLLPAALFSPKHMKLLIFALWLSYGSFGVFLLYSSFYIELVMHQTPMTTAVWYIPMVLGGLIIGMSAGFTLHLLPGRILLIIAGTGLTMCSLLFAIMPAGGLGGAVINSVVFLGISFFLGIADIAVGQHSHEGLRESYKVGFWVAVGLSGAQLAEELRQQELASQARGTAEHEPQTPNLINADPLFNNVEETNRHNPTHPITTIHYALG